MKLTVTIVCEGEEKDVSQFLKRVSESPRSMGERLTVSPDPRELRPTAEDPLDRQAPIVSGPSNVEQRGAVQDQGTTPDREPKEDAAAVATGEVPPSVDLNGGLDKRGWPWDGRIHTPAKTKKADGEWKNIRGVDKDLLAKVEHDLGLVDWRQIVAGGDGAVGAGEPEQVQQQEYGGGGAAFGGQQPPQEQDTGVVSTGISVPEFNSAVMGSLQKGLITKPDVIEALRKVGASGIPEFVENSTPESRAALLRDLGL